MEHAVIVSFESDQFDWDSLTELEDALIAAIEKANAGEYDGNEIAIDGSHGTLYMYGTDADALSKVVLPILEASTLISRAVATLRFGEATDPNARQTVVEIR